MDNLQEEIQEIFRDILGEDELVITRESNASNVPDWDSLTHTMLVTAIEKKYKIRFHLGELQGMKNVGDMLDLLRKKLPAQ